MSFCSRWPHPPSREHAALLQAHEQCKTALVHSKAQLQSAQAELTRARTELDTVRAELHDAGAKQRNATEEVRPSMPTRT